MKESNKASFKHQRKANTMSKNTNTAAVVDTLKDDVLALSDTSKKIRFLISKAPEGQSAVAFAYKKLKEYGVTTKSGGEIRYQHVRNVAITPLTSK